MRSTTGKYWIALDQLRALAALLVFVWHFSHRTTGTPVPFEQVPIPPFSLFDEGHIGVALFMTLSGYLFAKLLDGRAIIYRLFLWNRLIRLAPLLLVVMLVAGVRVWLTGESVPAYLLRLVTGFVAPTWPNGGWSIAVEMHFYLLLPALLVLLRRSPGAMLGVVVAAAALRAVLFAAGAPIEYLAYLTIIGRIDQFVLGMLAFRYRGILAGDGSGAGHRRPLIVFGGFVLFHWWFNWLGGYNGLEDSALWIVTPAIEGVGFAALILWYDSRPEPFDGVIGQAVARVGAYSYSIYLIHVFVVFHMARIIDSRIMDLSSFYVAFAWALPCFAAVTLVSAGTYHWIELPFLRWRTRYTR